MLNSLKCLMTFAALGLFALTGCSGDDEADDADSSTSSTAGSPDADGADEDHSHTGPGGHTHGPDDSLVWEDTQTVGELEIKLGHHAAKLHAGSTVEPAVSITRGGEAVADAEVFNSLLAVDEEVLAEEVPTIYEPETPDEPAHYAQGELAIPDDVRSVIIRFRIVADGEETTYDTVVPVEAAEAE